jgi:hypothetical protein
MNTKTRIEMTDSIMDIYMKMSEGNPGACKALMEMIKLSPTADPDFGRFAEFGPLLALDSQGIYGSRIWMLFKDVCKEQAVYALACLRAVQLGIMGSSVLDHAIDNRGEGLDVFATRRAVCERLPNFSKAI